MPGKPDAREALGPGTREPLGPGTREALGPGAARMLYNLADALHPELVRDLVPAAARALLHRGRGDWRRPGQRRPKGERPKKPGYLAFRSSPAPWMG
ncbi:MAG: hypothetical protein ABFS41_13600 [Myxococcota bacterium]